MGLATGPELQVDQPPVSEKRTPWGLLSILGSKQSKMTNEEFLRGFEHLGLGSLTKVFKKSQSAHPWGTGIGGPVGIPARALAMHKRL